MITLLSRLFIPDYENYSSPKVRQAYGILTGSVGIFFNFFLFVLKIVAGMISHSIAITADAFNNLSDAGSSVITLIGFKMSGHFGFLRQQWKRRKIRLFQKKVRTEK